jgi:transposase
MGKLQDIFIRLKAKEGIRQVTRELGVNRSVVRDVHRLALARGWFEPGATLPDEYEIAEAKYIRCSGKPSHPFDAHLDEIKQWIANDYSCVVIATLLRARIPDGPCSESTVLRYIRENMNKLRPATMVRDHAPGEILEVDFGFMGVTMEDCSMKPHKTWVFSARLRASRHAYRVCVHSQNQYVFYRCLIEALEYLQGVPAKVVPDNLKAAVVKAAFYEPEMNRVFRKVAAHYGFQISPCLPGTPEHKGGVENDIKYVKRNFLPVFKEGQKSIGRDVPLLADMNAALAEWTEGTAGTRIVRGVGASPLEMFHGFEKTSLRPLPDSRWDPVIYRDCKVGYDWRVQFDKSFYSVPYAWIGREVLVMADSATVCIFIDGNEIARHPRAKALWQYMRKSQHAPPHAEQYMTTTRAGLLAQAKTIGDAVGDAASKILSDMVVDGIRPVRGLLHLEKQFTAARLEKACQRALLMDTVSYTSVKSILLNRLEETDAEPVCVLPAEQGEFSFSRLPQEYQTENQGG